MIGVKCDWNSLRLHLCRMPVAVELVPSSDVSPWNLLHDGAVTVIERTGDRVSMAIDMFGVTMTASSASACAAISASPSSPPSAAVTRPAFRWSAHRRAAARQVAVVTGMYRSSRVSSSNRSRLRRESMRSSSRAVRSRRPRTATFRARLRRGQITHAHRHTSAGDRSRPR